MAVSDLIEIVDDEGGIEEEAHHLLRLMRSDELPQCRSLQASASAPVTISSSRMSLRTKVAFFIPAPFGTLCQNTLLFFGETNRENGRHSMPFLSQALLC